MTVQSSAFVIASAAKPAYRRQAICSIIIMTNSVF